MNDPAFDRTTNAYLDARDAMAPRVVALFQRVVRDKRPLMRMEMPQADMEQLGITDNAWGVPCAPGPVLAAYGGCMDEGADIYADAIRYEEVSQ